MGNERRNPNAGKIFVENSETGAWDERHPDGTMTPADGPFSQGVDPVANLPNLAAKPVDAETTAEEITPEQEEQQRRMLAQLQYVVFLEGYMAGYRESQGLEPAEMHGAISENAMRLAQAAWGKRVAEMAHLAGERVDD